MFLKTHGSGNLEHLITLHFLVALLRLGLFDAGDALVKNVPPPDKAPAKKPNSAPQATEPAPKTDLQLQVDRVRSRVLSLNNKKRPANASDAWFTRMVEVYGFRDTMIAVSISEEREVIQVSFIEGVIKRLTPREKENYDDDGLLLPEPAQSNYSNNNSGYKDYNKSPTTLDFSKYTTGKYAYLLAKNTTPLMSDDVDYAPYEGTQPWHSQ